MGALQTHNIPQRFNILCLSSFQFYDASLKFQILHHTGLLKILFYVRLKKKFYICVY